MLILPAITSLVQHLITPNLEYRPHQCPHCGKAVLWLHGIYYRKADREKGNLNPIPIQRFFCPACKKTCSVLPECIPPRRWYLWHVQQAVLLLYLSGQSLRAIGNKVIPNRRTIGRWVKRLQEQFLPHESVLRNHDPELGRTQGFSNFWKACLEKFSLASAMRLCHVAGVSIP